VVPVFAAAIPIDNGALYSFSSLQPIEPSRAAGTDDAAVVSVSDACGALSGAPTPA